MSSLRVEQPVEGEPGRLLAADTVVAWLAGLGLVSDASSATAETLLGGVSSVVMLVTDGDRQLVVKQPRTRLAVEREWLATPERARNEARALGYVGGLLPGTAPEVVAFDESILALAMTAAPQPAANWKSELLAGRVEPSVAARVGQLLGQMHARSREDPACGTLFEDRVIFHQLRVDPYYHALIERHPALGGSIQRILDRMAATRTALVHGDFTPKNILVLADGIWVLDWEIVHHGDPVFDIASVLAHLGLKAIHSAPHAPALLAAVHGLLTSYEAEAGCLDSRYLAEQIACFMLARVDGKSPAEYLTPDEQDFTRTLTINTLRDAAASLGTLLEAIERHALTPGANDKELTR